MPFQNPSDSLPVTPVLRVVSRERFQLVNDVEYLHEGVVVPVPHHTPDLTGQLNPVLTDQNSTDLATIPWMFTSLLARYGRQTLPALMHDALCVQVDAVKDQARAARQAGNHHQARALKASAWALRGHADYLFFCALEDQQVPLFRRTEFWAGVTLSKYFGGGKVWTALVMAVHVLLAAGPWLLLAGFWLPTRTGPVWIASGLFVGGLVVRAVCDRDAHLPLVTVVILPGLLVYLVGWLVGAVSLNLVTLLMNPCANLKHVIEIFKPTHFDVDGQTRVSSIRPTCTRQWRPARQWATAARSSAVRWGSSSTGAAVSPKTNLRTEASPSSSLAGPMRNTPGRRGCWTPRAGTPRAGGPAATTRRTARAAAPAESAGAATSVRPAATLVRRRGAGARSRGCGG